MSPTLPMFPLNSVLFPGVTVPLHVFEDRYRAMIHHLLRLPDPAMRVFGSVAIREGYEVGEHGTQSLYRIGCRVQLAEAEANPDGTFDIVGVCRDRITLDRLDTTGQFPVGHVTELVDTEHGPDGDPGVPGGLDDEVAVRARAVFAAYRVALSEIRNDPYEGELPRDATYLSWTLAACAPLPMRERQALLESTEPAERLNLVTRMLRSELEAMNVIPSLPATEVARTRWSPN